MSDPRDENEFPEEVTDEVVEEDLVVPSSEQSEADERTETDRARELAESWDEDEGDDQVT